MSQLDNKNNNTAKKTFFMLLIFTVVCAGFTVALIYSTISSRQEYSNNISLENTINIEEKTPVKESSVRKIKLTDKYFTNGITTEKKEINEGDIVYDYGNGNVERKIGIDYVQIYGLKNKSIQDKINKEIENQVMSLRDNEELAQENIRNIGIYADLVGSFSDVISISITKMVTKYADDNYEYNYEHSYENLGLNYSLKTGEEIKFNDLFTEDAAIKNIITQSVYDSLAWKYAGQSGDLGEDMSKLDYSDIENKTFKILAKYKQNPNFTFYFTPSIIYFIIDDVEYSIKMQDFYESIAIYTRYISEENLYENESLVKNNNYVFAAADMNELIADETNKTNNFHYRIIRCGLPEKKSEEYRKVENIVLDAIYKNINEYAINANKNKEKGYILDVIYYIYEYEGKISYNYDGYLCSMSIEFFNNNLEDVIAASMREVAVELWAKDFSAYDKENVIFEESKSLYVDDYTNPIETEQITTREDREKMDADNVY